MDNILEIKKVQSPYSVNSIAIIAGIASLLDKNYIENIKNEITESKKYLEKELAKLGIGSKFSSAKWDYWQTLLSRGDENLAEFLIDVYK